MNQLFVKTIPRKNAVAVSNYNHDEQHPDHKDRTEIMEDYSWKSEKLEVFGWETLQKYEQSQQHKGKENNVMREYIVSFPNEWGEDPTKAQKFCKGFIHSMAAELGVNEKNLAYEVVMHYNRADGKEHKGDNFHAHIMVYEREIKLERTPATYKKDIYQDKDGKLMKKAEAIAQGIQPTHRKGEIRRDKHGEIIYQGDGVSTFGAKCEDFGKHSFLQRVKERSRDIMQEIDPSLSLRVGREDPVLTMTEMKNGIERQTSLRLPMITYTRAEKRNEPERVELIKAVNKQRQELNTENRNAIKQKVSTKSEVKKRNEKYLRECNSLIEKAPKKKKTFEKILEITKRSVSRMREWIEKIIFERWEQRGDGVLDPSMFAPRPGTQPTPAQNIEHQQKPIAQNIEQPKPREERWQEPDGTPHIRLNATPQPIPAQNIEQDLEPAEREYYPVRANWGGRICGGVCIDSENEKLYIKDLNGMAVEVPLPNSDDDIEQEVKTYIKDSHISWQPLPQDRQQIKEDFEELERDPGMLLNHEDRGSGRW